MPPPAEKEVRRYADPAGLQAAREYAHWHLGYSQWADDLLYAYLNPETATARLKAEKEQAR